MIGYQPTIKIHQTKDKGKAQTGQEDTHHCCFISVVCPRLEILRMLSLSVELSLCVELFSSHFVITGDPLATNSL